MPKFFVSPNSIDESGSMITFDRENANHLTVLRHKTGDKVTVCNGLGIDYECIINSISKSSAALNILHKKKCASEPDFKVTLFQAPPKFDKMEQIIQKSVELGVYEIVPVVTQNTIVRVKDNIHIKTERYLKISEAAAKQCNRGIIPNISAPVDFDTAIKMLSGKGAAFIAYENAERNKEISLTQMKENEIGVLIGPEGGFTAEEVEKCITSGIKPISLGKRILRTETAGIAALAVIVYSREGDI